MPRSPHTTRVLLLALLCLTLISRVQAGREIDKLPIAPPLPELLVQNSGGGDDSALQAATPAQPVSAAPAAPSQNVVVNLINRMVEKGLLTKVEAAALILQAQDDTALARKQADDTQAAAERAAASAQVAIEQANQARSAPVPDPLGMTPDPDAVRVTYIPETVKRQLREEIAGQVVAQSRAETIATPAKNTSWVQRIKLFGDVRVRYEDVFFGDQNANTGFFPNFNAINTGQSFDVAGTVFPSSLNVDQDRTRFRLRARVGVEADLGEGFSAGLRIATGENNSPVTTNATFGAANQGQGGNFSKIGIFLDRAFLKYQLGSDPNKMLTITAGKFENPFFSTELIYDEDLGFDGIAVAGRYEIFRGFTPFIVGGGFPVFNTDFNFPTNQPAKFESTDKYLYAVQGGFDWKITKDLSFKLAAAYYYFDDIEGELSDPFTPLDRSDAGSTDNTRPSFSQKGNTFMALRNIVATPDNDFGTRNQFQFFGLATPFEELAITARIDYNRFEPFQISVIGEFVQNLAYDFDQINAIAINNRGASEDEVGEFSGGDKAFILTLRVGKPALEKRWDWFVGTSYRMSESDAVVDAFTDSDFGLGGTNLKGFTVFGALALSPRFTVGVRWLSADEVSGPAFSVDIIQLDINGKF